MTEKDEEIVIRLYSWIETSRGEGHQWSCRISDPLPDGTRQTCNCGRDRLLTDARQLLESKPFESTNGSGGH